MGLEEGPQAKLLEPALFAAGPLMLAIVVALPIALLMREIYPRAN